MAQQRVQKAFLFFYFENGKHKVPKRNFVRKLPILLFPPVQERPAVYSATCQSSMRSGKHIINTWRVIHNGSRRK